MWGTAAADGTDEGDNIVWGTDCGGDDCYNIVWGTASDGDNIVWGTASEGDNIVWGTAGDSDNIVWGTTREGAEGDNIVWGTSAEDLVFQEPEAPSSWEALFDPPPTEDGGDALVESEVL